MDPFNHQFDKDVKGLAQSYPQVFEALLSFYEQRYLAEPVIGDNSDETLRRVYRRDGKLEVIRDIKDAFFK